MIRRRFVICILALAFCIHISGQEGQEPLPSAAEAVTNGLMNGRGWRLIDSANIGVVYVKGYYEGAIMNGDNIVQEAWRRCSCPPADVAKGVTEFYRANPEYIRMPISQAIALFIMKANGVPRDTIDAEAARLMRIIADLK